MVTRLNEQPVILRNAVSPPGHWIALRLIGSRSNRDGLGAWIRLASASGEQRNRAVTSVGYGCSSDKVVHFGLGEDSRAALIEVRWPSGTSRRLESVQADRCITIEEPREP